MNVEEVAENDQVFLAEKFVEHLITEGHRCHHDERPEYFGNHKDLPTFYNEEMFKKGQDFYHKNTVGIFLGCFLALLSGFAQPFAKVLVMTNKSSTPVTAYKRYAATIMHMCSWYESDFQPGSKLWTSIKKVRRMHDTVSEQSKSRLSHPISQYEMCAAIIGFMGFPVMRNEMVGIFASRDELKCFIHFWRVMGYLLGIRDEFNICRESVEETKQICILLIQREMAPNIKKKPDYFGTLSKAFVSGMKAILPMISYDHSMEYLKFVVDSITESVSLNQAETPQRTSKWNYLSVTVGIMRFDFARIILNQFFKILLWLLKFSPIFAFYKFGFQNSRVKI
nr:uncharacterized protein LOC111510283 [Leptinotarsa decemlineata]